MHANTTVPSWIIGAALEAPSNKGECFENEEGLAARRSLSPAGAWSLQYQRQENSSGIVTSACTFVCHMSTPGGHILLLVNPGRRSDEEEEEEEEERLELPLRRGPLCRVCSAAGG